MQKYAFLQGGRDMIVFISEENFRQSASLEKKYDSSCKPLLGILKPDAVLILHSLEVLRVKYKYSVKY